MQYGLDEAILGSMDKGQKEGRLNAGEIADLIKYGAHLLKASRGRRLGRHQLARVVLALSILPSRPLEDDSLPRCCHGAMRIGARMYVGMGARMYVGIGASVSICRDFSKSGGVQEEDTGAAQEAEKEFCGQDIDMILQGRTEKRSLGTRKGNMFSVAKVSCRTTMRGKVLAHQCVAEPAMYGGVRSDCAHRDHATEARRLSTAGLGPPTSLSLTLQTSCLQAASASPRTPLAAHSVS